MIDIPFQAEDTAEILPESENNSSVYITWKIKMYANSRKQRCISRKGREEKISFSLWLWRLNIKHNLIFKTF